MPNFFISFFVFAVSVFLLGVFVRYGLIAAGRLDEFFNQKTGRNFTGYPWYYRLPFGVGIIPEYFFFLIIGNSNYFKKNWWPVKTSAFLSILIALATLNSRSAVYNYFTFNLIREEGFLSLFASGTLTWYLNIVVLLYLALLVLICIESIKMHSYFAPVRIFYYSLLSFMMALLTIIVLGLIIVLSLIYTAYKIVVFLFFSKNRKQRRSEEDEEKITSYKLQRGFQVFKQNLLAWEVDFQEERNCSSSSINPTTKTKPKIKISRKKVSVNKTYVDEVPRLHPD